MHSMKKKQSNFLPESISIMLRNLALRSGGILLCLISLIFIFVLFFYNPYLDGFATASNFGNQGIVGNIVGFIKYFIGFFPTLFLFACLGRFGLSLFVGWDEERAPEYNFLRGFVGLCIGCAGLGLMVPSSTFGGMFGSIIASDVAPILGVFSFPIGVLLFSAFVLMSCILLHIKWYHVKNAVITTYKLARVVLSAFHIIAPVEEETEDEEEYEEEEETEEDEEEEVVEKPAPKRRKTPRKTRKVENDDDEEESVEYELPPPELLEKSVFNKSTITKEMRENALLLQEHFEEYKIFGKIVGINPGPVITQYEFEPEPGTRVDQVTTTSKDMTRAMAAEQIRITPIAGTPYIGIEMENLGRKPIRYQTLMSNPVFVNSKYAIPLALGVSISGEPMYYDLAKMPHMLVSGHTGTGKSVFLQSLITSFVYHFTPDKGKLMIIDPKMIDFAVWEGVPHLITPVITDANAAVNALKWAVRHMDDRYLQLKKMGVRNIGDYNTKVQSLRENGEVLTEQVIVGKDEETGEFEYETKEVDLSDMPYLVIIIDEVADLMSVARKDVENCVQRLAAKARAAGIHLILATQRPSADVITGVIKSNFPTRLSFHARSNLDSITALGEKGAENLLKMGDMLFSESGRPLVRIHAAFVDDPELKRIADFWRDQGEPSYVDGVTDAEATDDVAEFTSSKDAKSNDLYEQAVEIVRRDKRPTTSYLQRRLGIGYNKAATLIERMEAEGVVSVPGPGGKRTLL